MGGEGLVNSPNHLISLDLGDFIYFFSYTGIIQHLGRYLQVFGRGGALPATRTPGGRGEARARDRHVTLPADAIGGV